MKKKVLYLFLYGLITMVLFFTASYFLSLDLHAELCDDCRCNEFMEGACDEACTWHGGCATGYPKWRSGRCSIDGSGCNNRYTLKCSDRTRLNGVCSVQCPECQIH
jgi:hypothetical protein